MTVYNKITDGIIYVDIDIEFKHFVYSAHYAALKRKIAYLETVYGKCNKYIRYSSSGNTHIKLHFSGLITVLDGFLIRAFLKDDVYRLSLDMARFLTSDGDIDEINRCFDEKMTGNGISFAGEWEDIDKISQGVIP